MSCQFHKSQWIWKWTVFHTNRFIVFKWSEQSLVWVYNRFLLYFRQGEFVNSIMYWFHVGWSSIINTKLPDRSIRSTSTFLFYISIMKNLKPTQPTHHIKVKMSKILIKGREMYWFTSKNANNKLLICNSRTIKHKNELLEISP